MICWIIRFLRCIFRIGANMNVLKSVTSFNLLIGIPTTLPHGLKDALGAGTVPDHIECDHGDVVVVSADDTDVTVRNDGIDVVAGVKVLCERWHTTDRALPPGQDDLSPQPFVPSSSSGNTLGGVVHFIDKAGIDVYVDGAAGDDFADGLTPATAIRTVREIYRKFPWYATGGASITVHFTDDGAGGVYTYKAEQIIMGGGRTDQDGADVGVSYRYEGPEMVAFAPATGPSTATLDVTPAVTVNDAGAPAAGNLTRFDFTTAAPAWTVDDLENSFIRITRAGTKVVREWPIRSNTADTITVIGDITALILATDTVEIVQPGAAFQAAGSTLIPVSGVMPNGGDQNSGQIGNGFARISFVDPVVFTGVYAAYDRCSFVGGAAEWVDGLMSQLFNCAGDSFLTFNASSSIFALPIPDAIGNPINTDVCSLSLVGGGIDIGGTKAVIVTFLNAVSIHKGAGAKVQAQCRANFNEGLLGQSPASAFAYGLAVFFGGRATVKGPTATAGGTGKTSIAGGGSVSDVRCGQFGQVDANWGSGVNNIEEVAGYNSNLQNYPITVGDQGDGSLIKVS